MFGVVSLTMGNSLLPLGVGLARDADDLRHLLLRHTAEVSQERQILCQHIDHLLVCAIIIRHEKESFHHTNLSGKCFLCSFCLRDFCPSRRRTNEPYPLLAPLLCIRPVIQVSKSSISCVSTSAYCSAWRFGLSLIHI